MPRTCRKDRCVFVRYDYPNRRLVSTIGATIWGHTVKRGC